MTEEKVEGRGDGQEGPSRGACWCWRRACLTEQTDLLDTAPEDDGLASLSTFFLSLEPLNPRLDLTYSHDKPSALQRPHFLSPSHLRCLLLQGMQATATAALLVGAESPVCFWTYLRPAMETGSGRGESGKRSYMSRSPSGESSGGVWSGRLLAMMSASQLRDGGLWKALRICDEETGALNTASYKIAKGGDKQQDIVPTEWARVRNLSHLRSIWIELNGRAGVDPSPVVLRT